MEEMAQIFLNMGVVGAVAFISFKTILDEKKEDRKVYQETISKFDDKLDKFAIALENNNSKLGVIEDDIKHIKARIEV